MKILKDRTVNVSLKRLLALRDVERDTQLYPKLSLFLKVNKKVWKRQKLLMSLTLPIADSFFHVMFSITLICL